MHKTITTYFILLILIVSGCTIEKRLYRKGWYISSWKSGHSTGSATKADVDAPSVEKSVLLAQRVWLIDTTLQEIPTTNDSLEVMVDATEKRVNPSVSKEAVRQLLFHKKEISRSLQKGADEKEKNRERNEVENLSIAVIAWLIFFSVLMICIFIIFPPANLSLFGLWSFVGVFLILFIGVLSLNKLQIRTAKPGWISISGDMLSAYRGRLLSEAVVVTSFLVALAGIFLILFTGELGILLFFVPMLSVLLFLSLIKWLSFLKARKFDSFTIMRKTADRRLIGDEPDFRKPTEEEGNLLHKSRIRRGLTLEVFLLFLFITTIWAASVLNPVSITLWGTLLVLFAFFTIAIWFEILLKNRHPEWERVAVEQEKKTADSELEEEPEDVEEEDEDVDEEAEKASDEPERLLRTSILFGFITVGFLMVLFLGGSGGFLWVGIGIFALAFIVTLMQWRNAKNRKLQES